MFERKKEICKWLNKEDYAMIAGYSELEAASITSDSYETILKRVIENRRNILNLPNEENPAPDAPLEKQSELNDLEEWLTTATFNPYSKKRQLYDSYTAMYRLITIIDYYNSIKNQDSCINEYVRKYQNDYELIERINLFYNDAKEGNGVTFAINGGVFIDAIKKHIRDKELSSFYFKIFGDRPVISDQDDIEAVFCETLYLSREQYIALKNYSDSMLPKIKNPELCPVNELISPRIIFTELEKIMRKEELSVIQEYVKKAEESDTINE